MPVEKCADCGDSPWIIKEPDGYWYVGCTIQCGAESEWDQQKIAAIKKWNETQLIKIAKKREAAQ